MKPSEVCLPQGGKQPGKEGIVGSIEPPPRNLLADIVSVVVLLLIGAGAILAISGTLQEKAATRQQDPAELNTQNMRQETVNVGSRPANLDPAMRTISDDASSLPTQDLVIKGLPGSPYQTPSLARKRVLRRLGTEPDARGWRFQHQLSAMAQKLGYARDSKRKWPKAFIKYLEAHQDFLRKIRRPSEIEAPSTRE